MEVRFKKKANVIDVAVTALAGMVSVGIMIYAIAHFGLKESWPELVLNVFYIACLAMMWLFFFNILKPKQFNYWCTVCMGITVMLRDILFAPHLAYYPIHLACLTLAVALLVILTYFYARREWETYSKRNLWMIFIIDSLIATLYNVDIFLEPGDQYTAFLLTEIWIRPTIAYGLVACFVKETKEY